jgi:hypothetical protein
MEILKMRRCKVGSSNIVCSLMGKIPAIEIWDAPDADLVGYPASRISGPSESRIPDIRWRPDIRISVRFSTKHSNL